MSDFWFGWIAGFLVGAGLALVVASRLAS